MRAQLAVYITTHGARASAWNGDEEIPGRERSGSQGCDKARAMRGGTDVIIQIMGL